MTRANTLSPLTRTAVSLAGRSRLCRQAVESVSGVLPILPPWVKQGREAVREWFKASRSLEQIQRRGGSLTMVDDCLASYCSIRAFAAMDKSIAWIADFLNMDSIEGLKGAIVGCDWGFATLYAAQRWNPVKLTGFDTAGKFGDAARELIRQHRHDGLFSNAEVVSSGEEELLRREQQYDFIFITRSYPFIDTDTSRQELYSAATALKVGGGLFIQLSGVNEMSDEDLFRTLEAAGCPDADIETRPVVGRAVKVRKAHHAAAAHAEKHLGDAGQDTASLVARVQASDYPAESPAQREERLRQAVAAERTELDTLPLNYMLKVTSRCNIRCRFCDYSDIKRHFTMSPTFLHQLGTTLDGTRRLTLSGGEPLLHPVTREIMQRGGENPELKISLATNMLAAAPHIELMADSLNSVACSLDAATAKTYESVRMHSNWRVVTGNLRKLSERKAQIGKEKPTLSLSFIIMNHNLHELADFVDQAHDLGADVVNYHWLTWTLTPRSSQDMIVDLADDRVARRLCDLLVAAEEKGRKYGMDILLTKAMSEIRKANPSLYNEYGFKTPRSPGGKTCDDGEVKLNRFPCSMPFTWMRTTTPDSTCFCHNSLPKFRYISIDPAASILDNWNGPVFREARELFYTGRFDRICLPDCPYYLNFQKKNGGLYA